MDEVGTKGDIADWIVNAPRALLHISFFFRTFAPQKIKTMKERLFAILMALVLACPLWAEGADTTRVVEMQAVEIVSSIKENGGVRQQPASVTHIGNRQMGEQQVTSLKAASSLVPNLFVPDYGSRMTSAIYIRGIGSRINTPAVGMYVDDIPYNDKSAFDFRFYDIEGMDILRGPQGTLYGSNTMGGLIRIHTKNPFRYEGTDVHLGYATGNHNRNVAITHYHHPSEQLAFSASGYYEGSTGFFSNAMSGKHVDDLQAGGGRLRAIWLPSAGWKLDASVGYDYSDEGAYPYFYVGNNDANAPVSPTLGTICNNRESRYRRSLLNAGANLQYEAGGWQMNAVTSYQHLNDRMFMDQDFVDADIYTLEQRQRIHTLNEEITFKNKAKGMWEWVSGANVMYQWLRTEAPVTFYEEGGAWLAGLINGYLPDVTTIPSLSKMGFSAMSVNFRTTPIALGGEFDTPTLGAALFHQSTLHLSPQLSATVGLRLNYEQDRMSYYAPSTVDYGFTLSNANPKSPMHVDLQDLSAKLLYDGKLSNDYLCVLPKLSLKYDFDADNNMYFSLGKGVRSGGYNIQMFSELLQGSLRTEMMRGIKEGVASYLQGFTVMGMPPAVIGSVTSTMEQNMPQFEEPDVCSVVYKPEQSWNYEVGTHLNLLGRRLQMDAAVFYLHTRDQQIARFAESGMGRQMVNAGKSQSLGAELSLRYMPNQHLALAGNYGYTHATFTEWNTGGSNASMGNTGSNALDYSNNYVPFVPRHTANLDAAYTWQLSHKSSSPWAFGSLTLGVNGSGAGRIYWTEDNLQSENFYSLLGARLTLQSQRLTLMLWGKNLTNQHYNTFRFLSAGRWFEQHAKPLQIGIDVDVHL